jgi:hypothetical protein
MYIYMYIMLLPVFRVYACMIYDKVLSKCIWIMVYIQETENAEGQ